MDRHREEEEEYKEEVRGEKEEDSHGRRQQRQERQPEVALLEAPTRRRARQIRCQPRHGARRGTRHPACRHGIKQNHSQRRVFHR